MHEPKRRTGSGPLGRGRVLAMLAATAAVATVAWPEGSAPDAQLPGLSVSHVQAPATSREASTPLVLDSPRALRAVDAEVTPLTISAAPELGASAEAKAQKKINKLQKKIAKKEAKIAAKEQASADAQAEIVVQQAELVAAQLALVAAEAMPETTPAEIKAKKKALKAANKAVNAANKKIAKQQKKIAKNDAKVETLEDKVDDLEVTIDELEVIVNGGQPGVPGLPLPEQMDVVAASEEGEEAGQGSGILPGTSSATVFPPGSDYETDEARSFVYDPAMESLGTVNSILCMMEQTAYDVLVNRGPYNAQIDEERCDAGGDTSSSGSDKGQSSGSSEEVKLWVVQSMRASADSDHRVRLWVPEDGGPEGPRRGRHGRRRRRRRRRHDPRPHDHRGGRDPGQPLRRLPPQLRGRARRRRRQRPHVLGHAAHRARPRRLHGLHLLRAVG